MLSSAPISKATIVITLSSTTKQAIANAIASMTKPLLGMMLLNTKYTSEWAQTKDVRYLLKLQQLNKPDQQPTECIKGLSAEQQLKVDAAITTMIDKTNPATLSHLARRTATLKETSAEISNLLKLHRAHFDVLLEDFFKAFITESTPKAIKDMIANYKLAFFNDCMKNSGIDSENTEEKSASPEDPQLMKVFDTMFTAGLIMRAENIKLESLSNNSSLMLSEQALQEFAQHGYKKIIHALTTEQRKTLITAITQNKEKEFVTHFLSFGGKEKTLTLAKDFFSKVVGNAPEVIRNKYANKIADYLVRQDGKESAQIQQETLAALEELDIATHNISNAEIPGFRR